MDRFETSTESEPVGQGCEIFRVDEHMFEERAHFVGQINTLVVMNEIACWYSAVWTTRTSCMHLSTQKIAGQVCVRDWTRI